MKKRYLFISGAKKWNALLRKFLNLHSRVKKGVPSFQELRRMSCKLKAIYTRLEKMQSTFGIKLAGTSLALMLASTTSFTQEFSSLGDLKYNQYVTSSRDSKPCFADYDTDGDIDITIADNGIIKVLAQENSGIYSTTTNLQADGADISVNSNAAHAFADIDNDGDLDLYIGSYYGAIDVFTNDGTGTFSSIGKLQADESDISTSLDSYPAFADIDGDNDLDLYLGGNAGTIHIYKNDGTGAFSSHGNLQANDTDIDVGFRSTPSFDDVDNDNDLDLIIGEWDGNVYVCINDGTGAFSSAEGIRVNGSLIDVGEYSAPAFFDIDEDNDLDLVVGEDSGTINVFKNDGSGMFTRDADLNVPAGYINVGGHSNPELADLDSDGDMDLIIGTNQNLIISYLNIGSRIFIPNGNLQADGSDINTDFGDLAPTFADVDLDGDMDLYIAETYENISLFLNDGSGIFSAEGIVESDGKELYNDYHAFPTFADIDDDNDLDLYVGNFDGNINVYTNDGAGVFNSSGTLKAGDVVIDIGKIAVPCFADIDDDNDLDLYIGEQEGTIKIFENDGNGIFNSIGNLQYNGSNIVVSSGYSAPAFASFDGHKTNLLIGQSNGKISEYQTIPTVICRENQAVVANTADGYKISGTEFNPTLSGYKGEVDLLNQNATETLNNFTLPVGTTTITWTATFNDGSTDNCSFDVVVSAASSIQTEEMNNSEISVYPNPSDGIINIETSDALTVSIIDISGKLVFETFIENSLETINTANFSKGVYYIQFNNDNTSYTQKLILK